MNVVNSSGDGGLNGRVHGADVAGFCLKWVHPPCGHPSAERNKKLCILVILNLILTR